MFPLPLLAADLVNDDFTPAGPGGVESAVFERKPGTSAHEGDGSFAPDR
jgi:hypothetical protein